MGHILWMITKILWAHRVNISEEGRSASSSSAISHLGLELRNAIGVTSVLLAAAAVPSPQGEMEEADVLVHKSFIVGQTSSWA